jgi:hypothetical protein
MHKILFKIAMIVSLMTSCASQEQKPKELGGIEVQVIDHHLKNCDQAEQNRLKNSMDSDTMCTTIDFQQVSVKAKDPLISDKINKSLVQIYCKYLTSDSSCISLDQVLNSIQTTGEEPIFSYDLESNVLMNDHHILSVGMPFSYDWYEGANPMRLYISANFNLLNGQKIAIDEIIAADKMAEFMKIVEQVLIEQVGTEMLNYEPGDFALPEDFNITPSGLQFNYDKYEIVAGMGGVINVMVPYEKIKGFIKIESILKELIK